MNVAELLHKLSEDVGFNVSDEALKQIVTNPALSQINLPDALTASINSNLMTEAQAKMNSNVKKHFTATALNGVDAKTKEILDRFGFDDDTKKSITDEPNSFARIEKLADAISDLKDKAISANGGDKKVLLDKINELQLAVNSEKAGRKSDTDEINRKWTSTIMDRDINSMFSNYDYALDLDKEISIATARQVWERELKAKGGQYTYVDGALKLVSTASPDLPFTIENKPVEIKSFTDSVLANNKLLKVAKAVTTTTQIPQNQQVGTAPVTPGAKGQTSKALEDYRKGSLAM